MHKVSRREVLLTVGAGLSAAIVSPTRPAFAANDAPSRRLRGAFMILHTPFTNDGAVDWDDLAREALFVDKAGGGIVWPQGSSSVATLTRDERLRGMELLATTLRGKRAAVVLGVQGKDTAEMLEYAKAAERLEPDAVIAMPPTSATSIDDYRSYFRALGGATRRPVVLQTSGGARNLVPPTDLIIDLAREFTHFGYVKEESEPLTERLREEIAHKPSPMKAIFSANFGANWLWAMRLGIDGVITGNSMYADLFATMWRLHEQGAAPGGERARADLRDAYARFLLMRNLNEQIPGADLYVMKKRGIFKTIATRSGPPAAGKTAKVNVRTFTPDEIAEIEYRFEALKPYLS